MSAIKKILDKYGCTNVYQGTHTFTAAQIKTEIDNLHPFCIFWHWSNGGGHFVDVYGYVGDIFYVMNPWPPTTGEMQQGTYDYLINAQNKGNWNGTVWTTYNASPYITLSSPGGGEQWEKGSTYSLKWSSNVTGKVKIELFSGSSVSATLAVSADNNGSFAWTIGDSIAVGNNYTIKITCLSNTAVTITSKAFAIANPFIVSAFPYIQNFDAMDTGSTRPLSEHWLQLGGDSLDWIVWQGPTPSKIGNSPNVTGPSMDHTSGSGKYVYIEASSPAKPGYTALVQSPLFDLSSLADGKLSFWAHMFSDSNQMGDLWVDVSVNGSWEEAKLHLSGDHGDAWFVNTLDLTPYNGKQIRIRFRGKTGTGWASDICVDDFVIDRTTATLSQKTLFTRFNMGYDGCGIWLQIPQSTNFTKRPVTLKLYDMHGKLIHTLVNSAVEQGRSVFHLDRIRENPAAGLYLCRVETAGFNKAIHIVVRE